MTSTPTEPMAGAAQAFADDGERHAAFRAAIGLHKAGKLREAEGAYRRILETWPGDADALHFLGTIALQSRRPAEAIEAIRKAIAIWPKPAYHYNLGLACIAGGDGVGAETAFRAALALDPRHAEAQFHLGSLLLRRNDAEAAVEAYRAALAARPDFVDALTNLGNVLVGTGRAAEAIPLLERARDLRPDDADMLTNLGIAQATRSLETALETYRSALAVKPDHFGALYNVGVIHSKLEQPAEAAESLRRAIAAAPRRVEARLALACELTDLERFDEAEAIIRQVIAEDPALPPAYTGLASMLRIQGRLDEASEQDRRALELDPNCISALARLAGRLRSKTPADERARLEALAEAPQVSVKRRRRIHHALAGVYESEDADRAFEHLAKGNGYRIAEFARGNRLYAPAKREALVDSLIAGFDKAHFARVAGMGSESELPIFVVGMPRSGTTLTEQILASHSQVHGAGELNDIPRLQARLNRPDAGDDEGSYARDLTTDLIAAEAERHVAKLRRTAPTAIRVVDKAPINFQNLGLIATLFPRVRILHCRRNPVDTCLSCFQQDFTSSIPWSCDLESLGHFYRQYERIMAHWRDVLPVPVLDVVYEDTVADSESTTRRILEFCGLDWEERTLAFHETDRPVRTASPDQARRPIYGSSVAKWRRYERHLKPLLDALDYREGAPRGS